MSSFQHFHFTTCSCNQGYWWGHYFISLDRWIVKSRQEEPRNVSFIAESCEFWLLVFASMFVIPDSIHLMHHTALLLRSVSITIMSSLVRIVLYWHYMYNSCWETLLNNCFVEMFDYEIKQMFIKMTRLVIVGKIHVSRQHWFQKESQNLITWRTLNVSPYQLHYF